MNVQSEDSQLQTIDEQTEKAFTKIVRSVNVSEQSSARMRKKLSQSGFCEEAVNRALAHAIDIGLIDDARYADMLIRSTIASGKGLQFALRDIEQLGVDVNSLDSYQAYLALGDDADLDRALEYLSSHPPKSKDVYSGAVRKLCSRGYPLSIAQTAARRFSRGECEDDFLDGCL